MPLQLYVYSCKASSHKSFACVKPTMPHLLCIFLTRGDCLCVNTDDRRSAHKHPAAEGFWPRVTRSSQQANISISCWGQHLSICSRTRSCLAAESSESIPHQGSQGLPLHVENYGNRIQNISLWLLIVLLSGKPSVKDSEIFQLTEVVLGVKYSVRVCVYVFV